MNVLVTGGCGFIGTNFIRWGLTSGKASLGIIVNLDNLTYAGNQGNLAEYANDERYVFTKGDIGAEGLVGELLSVYGIGAVINFAAESHVDRSLDAPETFIQTNVVSTLRLLNAARRHHAGLNGDEKKRFRFLHVSSDEVYGTLQPNEPAFSEQTPYRPNSPYAASKAASDHLVHAYYASYGLPTLTTNCSNNYGPYQFPEKLIPLVILNALEGRDLPIYGDGQQIRDWLYVADHVAALARVLDGGRIGETYNIGGGNERSNLEVVTRICGYLDVKVPREDGKSYTEQITHVTDRPGHDRRYANDFRKLQDELGWYPTTDFKVGLERTVDWYLTNRNWCAEITAKKYARERLGIIH
jgi:dTDP-glucose 4,6-dehydratase